MFHLPGHYLVAPVALLATVSVGVTVTRIHQQTGPVAPPYGRGPATASAHCPANRTTDHVHAVRVFEVADLAPAAERLKR